MQWQWLSKAASGNVTGSRDVVEDWNLLALPGKYAVLPSRVAFYLLSFDPRSSKARSAIRGSYVTRRQWTRPFEYI